MSRATEFTSGSPAAKPQKKNVKWNVRALQMRQEHPMVYARPGRGQNGESSN